MATTLTIDFASAGLIGATSASVVVSPAAAARLTIQTQPSSTATAGAPFPQQPVIRIEDQFGNLRSSDNSTAVTASRSAGSGTLQGTTSRTAVNGVVTFTNLSHNVATNITILFTSGSLTSAYSDQIGLNPGLADRLVFTTQPATATAGSVLTTQPVVKSRDPFGNDSVAGLPPSLNVTVNLTSGSGPLQGTTTLDIGTTAGNGTVSFADLRIDAAGTNKQFTASASGLANGLSSVFTINPAAGTKLAIQTQPSSTATAGANFPTQPVVRIEDQFGNRVTTNNSTVVTATRNAGTAALQGSTSVTVSNGLATFSNLSYNKAETITMDFSGSSLAGVTSANVTVSAAAASKLVIQTQPSATATAGVAFSQQPQIRVEDQFGNLRTGDSSTVVTAARASGTGTLQGTTTATASGGVASFSNLSYPVAETMTTAFSGSGLAGATSGNVVVSAGSFAKLQLLAPGETAVPGTASGKTGTPSGQTVGNSFPVTINAVDAQWNLVNTVSDTVGLSSSDTTATLPPATVLLAGTTNLTVSFNASGNFTLTTTDLTDGGKTPSTSPVIAVSPAQYTPATGGTAISADGATGAFTTLTGPSYSENASGNVGTGTIILKAPPGFVFDTGGTAPTVRITSSGSAAKNINGATSGSFLAMSSVTSTQLTLTVTIPSSGGVACTLTWQNVRVRPTAGTPLASGTLTRSGTATMTGVSPTSNLGTLREVPGAASRMAIQTQPSSTATAGLAFAQQPVLEVRDQFGNFRTNDNSTVVTAARNAGSGTLQGTTNRTAIAGLVTFTNLSHNVATNITLAFSASGVSGTNSTSIAISAAAADRLVFATQPGSTTYGSALSPQPVLKSRDPFGNNSTVGLGASQLVTLSVSTGTGSLLGISSLDIGTDAGNGTVGFSGLQVSLVGTNKQLSASSSGLTSAVSSSFDVAKANVTGSITANNKSYDGTTTATIAARALSGVLAGDDVSLSGGTATFASKTVGTAKTVTASGLGLSGLAAANYQLASTSASTTADITVRSLTVSATGVNKAYDGSTSATVTLSDNRVAGDSLTTTSTSASFADKNVGTAKPVSVSGIGVTGTDAANYTFNSSASTTANITAKALTISATGVNKAYDGTTSATVALSDNRVAGDSLSTSYSSATFATKSVGTNKTVSVSGISISGTDAPNYTANTSATTTANITAVTLTALVTADNKSYDGTTAATIATRALSGTLAGDNLSLSGGSATFATKTVGTAKTVTATGLSLNGTDAANYQLASTSATTTADITARSLSVSATGVNKAYDGTTNATVTLSDNRVAGDSLSTSYTSASFADKNVGTNKPVSVNGIAVNGTDAANYSANTSASTTANITARSLSVTATGSNKVYDGTTNATVTLSDNRVVGDSLTTSYTSANFATKSVGTNKPVSVNGISISGADAANYSANITASATANITPRSLVVSATGVNKVYNGTTTATVSLSDNRVAGDSLTTSSTSASFADKNVGTAKNITVSGVSVSGTDAANYSANTSATTTADITARSLTLTATGANKIYDGTTDATVTLSDNRLAGDVLSTSYSSATFATKSVGTAKTVSVSGISVGGTDAGNYTANTSASATANISARSLTVSATGVNKVYDRTTNATVTLSDNRAAGDSLSTSYTSAGFATKNVGTNKTVSVSDISVSGTDAGNYQLTSTNASTTANITARSMTVSATGVNKAYDGTTSTTVSLSDNRVAGDSLTTSYTSASFADKNVGNAKPVSVGGIGVTGTDAANYTFNSSASTTANITVKALTISATGVNKAYDGTTSATVALSDSRVAGDSLSTSYSSAAFANKSVGTNKTVSVSGISISGTDAPNYTANTTASATANITTRSLSVTVTGSNKVYDGSTAATVTLADNRLAGDSLTASYTSASFANKNVGMAKTVSVSGISIGGADAANYSGNTTASTTADITVRSLTVSATGVNKVYDGTTAATVTLADNRLAGDSLSTSYTSASFADPLVGTAKSVSVSGISISGTDATNYSVNTTASATGNISAASLTALVTANNKIYDGTTNATIATRALSGVLDSDDVSLSGGSASFASKTVGTNKTVSVIGLSLSGADAANYQLGSSSTTTTANISARSLTVSATGITKVYNGSTNATVTLSDNRVAGDSLATSSTSAGFADKNVGTNKTVSVSGISISGTDAPNYTANSTTSTTADITARTLTVSATGGNKVYDGSADASVLLADDRLVGDSLSTSYSSASFATKSVGTNKTVSVSGISVSGADSANYSANTSASTTANISAKGLTVSAITANDKVYDASNSATLNTTSAALVGAISGDTVTLNTSSATGAFADKNVGTNKTVSISALSLSGADAGNYFLTQPTTTASISKAGLNVTADNKSRAAGAANPTLTASYSGFVGGEILATSGVTGNPALSTTDTNVAGTYPITAALGTLSAANYSFSFVNGVLTVTPASANSLVIVTQPSSTAIAGVPFAQQPAIRIQDAYGNLRSSDNSTVLTAARNAGSGTLQGSLSATAVNGVAAFANLSHNVANTINLTFSSSGLTNVASANILVSPATFAQLQLLVPGEAAAPGTVSGKTGTPNSQIVGASFPVTVNAADSFWNLVNTVSDTVGLNSSDATATLQSATALAGGTTNLTVSFNATGNFTLTANDLSDGSKGSSTSPAIAVGPAQYTLATGGGAISADTTGGSWTALTGPSYSETASGNVGTGTIILSAPTGFVFDTGGTVPTMLVTRLTGSGSSANNINDLSSGTAAAMTSVTSTQLVFTVTASSASGITCSLTWQNVRVRPTAGAPLTSGNLTRSGTASVVGLSTNANLGTLREVAGAANKLAIQTQASSTATAGVAFAQQPVLEVRDQFGNFRTNDSTTAATAARTSGTGSGTLQGTTNRTALNGLISFTNLFHNVATNITLRFSSGSLSNTTSATIAINPAPAAQLVFVAQPGNGVVGSPLSAQPILRTRDQFGNDSAVGLGSSKSLTLTLTNGSGPLVCPPTMDIGTNAGNGLVSFTNLQVGSVGTNKQLTASASGLSTAVSSVFSVAKANQTISFSPLSNKTYGDPSFTLSATASSGLPVTFSIVSGPATLSGTTLTMTGAGSVTVRATQSGDANWNAAPNVNQSFTVAPKVLTGSIAANSRIYDGTTAAAIATRTLSGVVGSDNVNLTGGTATFANKNAGNGKTVTATGLSLSGTAAGNYQLASTSATTTADITAKGLTISGLTANNKVYDGTTTATLNANSATLMGVVGGDDVTLSTGSAAAVFANANVGTSKTVTVSGLTLSGVDAGNYTLTQPSATANVTPATITVTADNKTKTYGATNPGLTASYGGFVNGDNTNVLSGAPNLTTTADINSPVGPYTISVTNGTLSAMNYDFTFIAGQLTITQAVVSVPAMLTGIQVVPNGIKLTFSASASRTYQIERASALQNSGTVWTNIGSATTDSAGQGDFTDTNPPAAQGYYRTVSP